MRTRDAAAVVGAGFALLAAFALPTVAQPPDPNALAGKITEFSGGRVRIARGSADGVRERQVFDLYAEGKAYLLPLSGGEKLKVSEVLVGRAVVTQVDSHDAYARAFETFPEKGSIAVNGYAVLNPAAPPPELKPIVKTREPAPHAVAWRTTVPIRLEVRSEPGRKVYYEWRADGGTFLRGIQVVPGVFRTSVPENDWVACYAKKNVKANIRVMDTGGEGHVNHQVDLESTGPGGPAPSNLHVTRSFTAASLFQNVRDMAWDSANRLYVIDKPGRFADVIVRGLDDRGNDLGTAKAPGNVTALAVTDDWFYFLDSSDNVVRRYNASGIELAKIFSQTPSVIGEKGDGNGRLREPVDLAVAPDGALLVLDASQKCIQRFDRDGRFAYSFGMPGEGEHQLSKPVALAIGPDGTVYVLDDGRKRILSYKDGRVLPKDIEAGSGNDELKGLALDPFDGSLHVLEGRSGSIKHFSARGETLVHIQSKNADDAGALSKPVRLRIDQTRLLYVADREGGSLARFDAERGTFTSRTGGVKIGTDVRIAASPGGDVAILDKDSRTVTRFDRRGWITQRFGGEGSAPGQLKTPVGIAIDSANQVYVVDAKRVELAKYLSGGIYHKSTSGGGTSFQEIRDLQVSSHREMLAVLQDRERGLWLMQLDDQLGDPNMKVPGNTEYFENVRCATIVGNLAGNDNNAICWVADKKGERVSEFNWKNNDPTKVDRDFDKVTGMVASVADLVFICDRGNKQIDVYNGLQPRFLTTLKDKDCEKPIDVATDDFGHLFVFDESGDGKVFEFGE